MTILSIVLCPLLAAAPPECNSSSCRLHSKTASSGIGIREGRFLMPTQRPPRTPYRLAFGGLDLSESGVKLYEKQLEANPDDLEAHVILLGHYSSLRSSSPEVTTARHKHALWLIRHHPAEESLGTWPFRLFGPLEPEAYLEASRIWLQHVGPEDVDTRVLANAASFFDNSEDSHIARKLLERGRAREPNKPYWSRELGRLYERETFHVGLKDEFSARKALDHFEDALSKTPAGSCSKRLFNDLVSAALACEEWAKARQYARAMLARSTDSYSIHKAKTLLGHAAFRSGNIEDAERYLLEAGKACTSSRRPWLRPNTILAKRLLEQGRTDAVIEYLRLCEGCWDSAQLETWINEIEDGRVPNFIASPSSR